MNKQKNIKVINKTDKPDNVVQKEKDIMLECEDLEEKLPKYLRGYFSYLKSNVLPMTRLEYLRDVNQFFEYLVNVSGLVDSKESKDVTRSELNHIKARDVNDYIDYSRNYKVENDNSVVVYSNNNKTLARKKSSISVLFKQLYRDEIIDKNITDGFDPIRVPKPGEREIKALQDDEVMIMLDAVSNGTGMTKHQLAYWERTKLRDKAMLVMFLTYGLRLSELQQLNVSSFNFSRGEFKIYRKRGKESIMPLNRSATIVLSDYIESERMKEEDLLDENKDALFLSLQGTRLTERQIRDIVKKYTSIALGGTQDKGYSPHKLRATAATSLIGRGYSIYDVKELLDHEQVTTTQLYAKQRQQVKRDLVKGMEWELERKA